MKDALKAIFQETSVMADYSFFYKTLEEIPSLASWNKELPQQVHQAIYEVNNGNLPGWLKVLELLPKIVPSSVDLNTNSIRVGTAADCEENVCKDAENLLRQLHPWRKGPYTIFGIDIDTEWRSDMKWNRLKEYIAPLKDRIVLDVGSSNGYHCWRMAGEGARLAIGIDPALLYVLQYHALQHFIHSSSVAVLPLGIDDMPEDLKAFDTVFSMGLLYHRRAPFDHLLQLKSFLREGGELVLETLVIDGGPGEVLSPTGRYAKMPNVWFLPSVPTLEAWLKRCRFSNVRLADLNQTTTEEQRATDWMGFQSLETFLDPDDPNKTVEGYPAPRRALFLANK